MHIDQHMNMLSAYDVADESAVVAWSASDTAEAVACLYDEAERHFYIDAHRSLDLAQQIERIGQIRIDPEIVALGLMKQGDALRFLGQFQDSWNTYGAASAIMQKRGDEVGWARTRIGRLFVCVDLFYVTEALEDAERAREIFERHALMERLVVLELHLGVVYKQIGDLERSLAHYHAALAIAEDPDRPQPKWRAALYTSIGNLYQLRGDLDTALRYHLDAGHLFAERDETSGVAIAGMNAAHVRMAQGHYRPALRLLHEADEYYRRLDLPLSAAIAGCDRTECLLSLNRYLEAYELATEVAAAFAKLGLVYEQGVTLLHLASAAAALGKYGEADTVLAQAAAIFGKLDAHSWSGKVDRCRAQIAFHIGDLDAALDHAMVAEACFEATGHTIDAASVALVRGKVAHQRGDAARARDIAHGVLRVARRCHVPALRYEAHLLLGNLARERGDLRRACQRYHAAIITVEQVQRHLTITLRPAFLGDKEGALRALIGLYIEIGDAARAFATLERAKSQVFLNYLIDRDQLHWRTDDPATQPLIAELEALRARHHWLYKLVHGTDERTDAGMMSPDQARTELAATERQIRALTEHLYLQSDEHVGPHLAVALTHHDIQRHLDSDTVLVEYYSDATGITAFVLDRDGLIAKRLLLTPGSLEQVVANLGVNIAAALNAGMDSEVAKLLSGVARKHLERLYADLLAPLATALRGRRRLVIVPYGVLHFVPMHLLHTGTQFLIEQMEVVVMPNAGLLTQHGPARTGGATVLAHSWDHLLPQVMREANAVAARFPGVCFAEHDARRTCLHVPPTQVLHIAAHAAFRLDQPELSFIELADGQVFADDLMQEDMSYELVTLSACETGRAHVAAGDELIGLGRGFLYGGAGAVVASLWRVADDVTVSLMEHFYQGLLDGKSKAAALREAQCAILHATPMLHPAFWGAFQLLGDARPLSSEGTIS